MATTLKKKVKRYISILILPERTEEVVEYKYDCHASHYQSTEKCPGKKLEELNFQGKSRNHPDDRITEHS